MKRFWLVLLSLGLIVAFSTTSFAQVDVKFSGEFVVGGMYLDQTSLVKNTGSLPFPYRYIPTTPTGLVGAYEPYAENQSTAFYFQRLRLNTVFTVSPGLMLTTRMDIMERVWGANRSPADATTPAGNVALDTLSAGTRAENQNIAIDLAYVTYVSPIGMFSAGYMIDGAWGTVFGDSSLPTGKVTYTIKQGPVIVGLQTGIGAENSLTAINPAVAADRDSRFVTAFGVFAWKTGQAGLLFKGIDNRTSRDALDPVMGMFPFGSKTQTISALPYVKAKVGPVALQAELIYTYGTVKFEDESAAVAQSFIGNDKVSISNLSAWVDAVADLGVFYAGGTLAYMSGDDPSTKDKNEGGGNIGGLDWNPTLILFNNDLTYWAGNVSGYYSFPAAGSGAVTVSKMGGPMSNVWFAQVRGGVRPIDKLDIGLAVSYAHADKTPTVDWQDRDYGYEVDLTATYKITNNLSYMLGAGYLFTGKYFKADYSEVVGVTPEVTNNYMVINKLTLTF